MYFELATNKLQRILSYTKYCGTKEQAKEKKKKRAQWAAIRLFVLGRKQKIHCLVIIKVCILSSCWWHTKRKAEFFGIEAGKVKGSGTLASAGEGKKLNILGWIFISNVSFMKKVLIIDGWVKIFSKFWR